MCIRDSGCIGEGKSVEETKADFMKAVGEMQEVYAEEGSKFPDVEFDFIYDMASFLNYYAYAFSLACLLYTSSLRIYWAVESWLFSIDSSLLFSADCAM